jgi:hypothetical protein
LRWCDGAFDRSRSRVRKHTQREKRA